MPELSVAIVAANTEQRSILQVMVDGTGVARTSQTFGSYPVASTDPVLRKIHADKPDVVLIDIPLDFHSAMRAIELVHQEIPATSIFAIGSMIQPQLIVTAMRSGAREFIERPTKTTELLEAFLRLSAAHRKVQREEMRGRMFTVVNAKGGSGATTIAVNLALALQSAHNNVALVDASPLGHIALHLNLKPAFTVADAIQNLHRLDGALLESLTTRHSSGLQLLAGTTTPTIIEPSTGDLARLFDLLLNHFRYVVVDVSSRVDSVTRLLTSLSQAVMITAHSDVASLWSASKVQQYLGDNGGSERLQLVLNRYRKTPGFSEADAAAASGMKLLWKVPNQYFAAAAAIDRGVPLMLQGNSEIARSFTALATKLTEGDDRVKRAAWSLFKIG